MNLKLAKKLPSLRNFTVGILLTKISFLSPLHAQLVDETQVEPTVTLGTIGKSLEEQIGLGRGDVVTPQSSIYIIKRDPARSIRRGRQLFQRKFTLAQGLGPRVNPHSSGNIMLNPGLGAGLSDSCAACHGRPRGSAGFGGAVATRPDSRDSPHLFGLGLQEMIADEMTQDLRRLVQEALLVKPPEARPQEGEREQTHSRSRSSRTAQRGQSRGRSERNNRSGGRDRADREGERVRDEVSAFVEVILRSKGVDFGKIIMKPDGEIVDRSGLKGVDDDLRVRPFFAQGSGYSIREFIVGALKDEMGLESPDPDLLAASKGGSVVTPSGLVLDGQTDTINAPPVSARGEDGDGDGVANEVDTAVVDHLEFYLLNYFKPGLGKQTRQTRRGQQVMKTISCIQCHKPNFTIERDRRIADVETVFSPENGIFNRLYATAETRFDIEDDGEEYPKLLPSKEKFVVKNIYTDFKRHDLGPAFHERNYDGTLQTEFMTEPLWGVGSTSPYGHDGRSINLEEVILRHGGEAERSKKQFERLREEDQSAVIAFLRSLVLFPPDDTASNLNPGNPNGNPQDPADHGSINLGALFQIPDPDGLGE
ncbi:MAG: hypothetical protein ACJAQT_002101 [Akkermansiaceae bacterium]|jgi:hypothetical protein